MFAYKNYTYFGKYNESAEIWKSFMGKWTVKNKRHKMGTLTKLCKVLPENTDYEPMQQRIGSKYTHCQLGPSMRSLLLFLSLHLSSLLDSTSSAVLALSLLCALGLHCLLCPCSEGSEIPCPTSLYLLISNRY